MQIVPAKPAQTLSESDYALSGCQSLVESSRLGDVAYLLRVLKVPGENKSPILCNLPLKRSLLITTKSSKTISDKEACTIPIQFCHLVSSLYFPNIP